MTLDYKPIDFGPINIPPHMKEGLERYIRVGIMPGNFLQAVLSNDFAGAVLRADAINEHCLREYALLLHSGIVPDQAWGSRTKVDDWIKRGGERGL